MSSRPGYRLSRTWLGALALVSLACVANGCGGAGTAHAPAGAARTAASPADAADAPLPPPAFEAALPEGVRAIMSQPFTGDLDQMLARRLIRVAVAANRMFYFVDNGAQRGAAYELGQAFEQWLNEKLKTKPGSKINVVFVPLPRDLLAPALVQGRVDCVVAQVIVRPELQAIVDFTNPVRSNVSAGLP